ncbi:MAG TPA: isoprenylcysteine carboxylmethyltransferase family protein [Microvirga sp.]|jgi:protein-S-isoprenylcysteine O-methyltransferase Ste14|nr:isoprenylcysteine carboxylmethyltransferase family protein [Microvirga sp.]
MDFGRAMLACYFTFIAVYYTAKLLALRSRTGTRHADFGGPGTAQYVGHRLFKAFRVAIWGICVLRVFWPEVDRALIPFEAMTGVASLATGLSLLLVCLALTVYVHSYMGEAWRSGVAPDGPKHLITAGPFARLRHPLFTAIAIGQIGFFLALPSLFSLVCLAVGLTVLVVQARFEEQRMAVAFGQAWRDYARAVPAFVPRIGPALAGESGPEAGLRQDGDAVR